MGNMKNERSALAIALGIALLFTIPMSGAQDSARTQNSAEPGRRLDPAITPYHAEFILTELEDGKKINARHFSIDLNSGHKQTVKIGARVPVEIKQEELQYLDVGTNIDCHLVERENGLALDVSADFSSAAAHSSWPLIRRFSIEDSTVVVPGKPVIISTADDPETNHDFQLQVIVTKVQL